MKKSIWLKISEKLTPLLIIILPSFIGGGILGIYPGYKIYEFIWKDARFCTSCHVHDYAKLAWETSSHGKFTTCHDCHHQPLKAYLWESFMLITNQTKFPKDLSHLPYIPNDLCEACHVTQAKDTSSISGPLKSSEIEKLPKIDQTYLHQVHLKAKTKLVLLKDYKLEADPQEDPLVPQRERGDLRTITCSDCHGGFGNRGHNYTAVDSACIRCHEQIQTDSKMVQQFGCRNCHFDRFLVKLPKQAEAKSEK